MASEKKKVLVTYASKYGATAGIAERIGEILRETSLPVDVLPVKGVKDPTQYRAVVLGTAMYMFQWRKEAVAFLKRNEKVLATQPVWLFASGPLGGGDPVEVLKGKIFPEALRPLIEKIKPRDIVAFHGMLDMQKLNFFERFVFKRAINHLGDFRDWKAISAWAESIGRELKK
jgi:menaquinone-dependent protoporphyrinogen oxidase